MIIIFKALTNSSATIDSVNALKIIIIQADNSVDSIYGQVGRTEIIERRQNIYNSFRQLEFPFLLNYETNFDRLHFELEAGIRIRILRKWEGLILDPDENITSLQDEDWYRNGLGASFQTGLYLGWQLSPALQLRLGGTFRYSPTAFTKQENFFEEGYQLRGVQLGLLYQLK